MAINAFSGVAGVGELGFLKWRPGGGNSWFLPGWPLSLRK
jgi:4-cresol dehydrogenase (hydroxylating) flavoprotein subunit